MTRYTRQERRQFCQLAQLLSRSIDATRSKAALPAHPGAWEVVIKVAGRNLVLPNLYPVLKAKGLLGTIDPEIVRGLARDRLGDLEALVASLLANLRKTIGQG